MSDDKQENLYQIVCGVIDFSFILLLVYYIVFLWWAWPRFDRATSIKIGYSSELTLTLKPK